MLSRARALWRHARNVPILRGLLASADRAWWARTIRRAGIVDTDVVAAQLGRAVSVRTAVRVYVRGGFRTGFTLNPLMMERTVSRQLSDAERVPALYAYLVNDRTRVQVSPAWDAAQLALQEPTALHDPAGPLGFAWRRAQREGWVDLGDAAAGRRVAWTDLMRALTRPAPARRPSTTESLLVCVVGPQEADADQTLVLARDAALRLHLDVDLILTGESFDEFAHATLVALGAPRITVRRADVREAGEPPADRRAAVTAFRGPDATVSPESMRRLVKEGRDAPVAALWLSRDGTIRSAGTVFHHGASIPLLAGHPVEDARRLGAAIPVPMLAGPARAWPGGSSPRGPGRTLTDATASGPGAPDEAVEDTPADTDLDAILAPAGLAVARWRDSQPVLKAIDSSASGGGERLRWAIKTSAPAGPAGESWGDTHFARGLAGALQRLGHFAAIDAYPARDRSSNHLDQVTLVLRGPHRIAPPPTGRRILWIISHPDEVSAAELDDFDVVFAASRPWAEAASGRLGRPVHPLLQCTDTSRFHPTGAARGGAIVFVGTARGIARPVVVEPLKAGIPVHVYGPDWTGYISGSAIVDTGVPNARLPKLYETAAVVLNDHWPAMRREGFISNRLFDVVAAGGRAISDDVDGIAELFGGAVREFRSVAELIEMLRGDLDALFPSSLELEEISDRVRALHSFDARAATLLAAARSV